MRLPFLDLTSVKKRPAPDSPSRALPHSPTLLQLLYWSLSSSSEASEVTIQCLSLSREKRGTLLTDSWGHASHPVALWPSPQILDPHSQITSTTASSRKPDLMCPSPLSVHCGLDTLLLQYLSNAARIQIQLAPRAEPLIHLKASLQTTAY